MDGASYRYWALPNNEIGSVTSPITTLRAESDLAVLFSAPVFLPLNEKNPEESVERLIKLSLLK